ncbi:MAG: UPF0147 family protein [Candidatus Aenigmatarchaeota archaeon]|nr:MAG: UPF0147 family protein [Candidatus Aenigmarchaeota archaeon]
MEGMQAVIDLLESVLNDRGVPKNVKESVEEGLTILKRNDVSGVQIAEAASILDEVSNDPNLSVYGRTVLWDAISKLEALK